MKVSHYTLKGVLLAFLIILIAGTIFSQKSNSSVIAEKDRITGPNEPRLFVLSSPRADYSDMVYSANYLKIDRRYLQQLFLTKPQKLLFSLPFRQQGEKNLLLERRDVLAPGFKVSTPQTEHTTYVPGVYYKGEVEGVPGSNASISIFADMLMGIISIGEKDYVLGHLDQQVFPAGSEYILYDDADLRIPNFFECYTQDQSGGSLQDSPAQGAQQKMASNVLEVYFQADYGLYQNKNSDVQQTVNYVTGFFNNIATIYANEDITMQISEVFVWTTQDPYPSNSSSSALTAFRDATGSNFNGDIAHLVALDPGGLGGIAYLDVLCNKYWAKGYSDINSTYLNFPTYSWTVQAVTHEIGHNLGSKHTHACAWGPHENEAMDGCGPASGYSEGCNAPVPTGSGTIMSYCHLVNGIGISFNNGFGAMPGDKIRYEVSNALCLFPAGPKPNLDKTGSDNLTVNNTIVTFSHVVINNDQLTADSTVIGYYLTPNTTLSTYDYLIGTKKLAPLGANQNSGTITFTVNLDTLQGIPPGTYYGGYILDHDYELSESDENDNNWRFTAPQVVKTTNNFTCVSSFQLTTNGTYTSGTIDTGNGCYNCSGGANDARWFKYQVPANGFLDAIACGQGVNTRLWVYRGNCNNLTQVAASDDECQVSPGGAQTASLIDQLPASKDTTYYFEWDDRWSSGSFQFDFAFYKAGEKCKVADVIPNTGSYPKTIAANGPSSGNGCHNCGNGAMNADWFKWTAPTNGTMSVASCNGGEDTRLWVYSGSCGALVQLGSSDDSCPMGPGQLSYASQVNNIVVNAGTTYYFEWDDIWSSNAFNFTLSFTSTSPSCTALQLPANGATNVNINADLSWTAATYNPTGYRLTVGTTPGGGQILNNVDVGNVTTYDPGAFPFNTTIYVKIAPYNGSGTATSCSTVSFTTETAPVPLCTSLTAPANGASNVNINADLSWNAAGGNPTGYRLTVGTTSGGGQILNNADIGNVTTYDPGILPFNSTIFVKIVPYNGAGNAIGCIEQSFSTEQIPPPQCVALTAPANGATDVSINADLSWNAAGGNPTGYRLTIGTTSGGGQILNNADIGNVTTYDPGTLPFNTTVFVKIVPYNAGGNAVGCTETNFTTQLAPPSCTSLSAPFHGATGVSVNVDLYWNVAGGNPTGYRLTVGTSSGGGQILNNVDVGNVTTYDPGILPYNTTIFVKIVPYNGTGNATGCTEQSFTTEQIPAPTCTSLISPPNSSTGASIQSDLSWNVANGNPAGYRLTVGTNSGGGQIVNNVDVGNVTFYDLGTLPYNTAIFVKIVPYNAGGNASGCPVEYFITEQVPAPGCTALSSPLHGATAVDIQADLSWNAASGNPSGYRLTVGTTNGGGQILNNVDVSNVTTYDPGALPFNTTIFVKIVPYNAGGNAAGCPVESFTTQISPPNCTALSSPLNGATGVDIDADLSWNTAGGNPTGYRLTVGTTSGGGQILNNVDVGNVTSYDPGTLPFNTTIFVKIVPYNAGGNAGNCIIENFTTESMSIPLCTSMTFPVPGSQAVNINADLSWGAASGDPSGYRLTVGTTSGGGQILNNVDVGNVTTYDLSALPYNTMIFVKIVPYNTGGNAIGCSVQHFTTENVPSPTCGVPVPTYVTTTSATAYVTWSIQNGATKYQLKYRLSGTGTWTTLTANNVNYLTINWLFFDKTYEYQLRAYCDGVWTTWSSVYEFTTDTPPVCTLPLLLNHTVTSTSITVKWRSVPTPNAQELGYRLKGATNWTMVNVNVADSMYTITGLASSTEYQYRLRVQCGNDWSIYTATVNAKSGANVPIPSCTALTAPANGATSVNVDANLSWNAASGGATGYRLTVGTTSGGSQILDNVDVGNVTTYDPGTMPYSSTIFVMVVPYNAGGQPAGCTIHSFTTQAPSPPACTNLNSPLHGEVFVSKDANLFWNTAGGNPTGYRLTVGTTSGGGQIANNIDVGNVISFEPGTLPYNTTIYVKIIPYNTYGNATGCSIENFTTESMPSQTCSTPIPTNVTTTNKSATVTWTMQNGATQYQIKYRQQGTSTWKTVTKNNGINSHLINWLYFGTTYQYQLRTNCPSGWTAWSGNYTFTTNAAPTCTLPLLLNHTTTATTITVKWRSILNPAVQELSYRKKGTTTWTKINVNVADSTYTITGLLSATIYQYRLRVKCGGTWSTYTTTVNATTASSKPGKTLDGDLILNEHLRYSPLFELSPNPVLDLLNLSINPESVVAEWIVTDLTGKPRQSGIVEPGQDQITIEVSDLSPGLYLLIVKSTDGQIQTEKFVKAH